MSDDAPNLTDAEGRKVGRWREPDPHGGVMEGEYVEGRRHGEWAHYFADGSVRSRGTFRDDLVEGEWVWNRSSGGLLQRGSFLAGEKHGLWERWSVDGSRIDSGHFDRGKKVGEWVVFNPDGSVKKTTRHRSRPD